MCHFLRYPVGSINLANAVCRFLWAALQIDEVLKRRTKTMIRKALQDMPSHIYGAFDQTMPRIGDDDLALRTLLWLACAKEPLDFPALSHALSIDLENPPIGDVDEENIPAIEVLVEACCGFVTVDGRGNLRFVHATVQEYFESHPEKLHPLCEMDVAKTCLSYLSLKVFESGYCDSKIKIRDRLQQYPLLFYAARRWADHVPQSEQYQIEETVLSIYHDKRIFSSYSQVHYYSHAPDYINEETRYFEFQKGYTPLHNAVDLHLSGVTGRLLEEGYDPSVQTTEGITPLHFAVQPKGIDLVYLLLSAGADASIRGKVKIAYDSDSNNPPILINRQARASMPSALYRSSFTREYYPVTLAAIQEYHDIFKVLSEGASLEVIGEVLKSATQFKYHQELVRQILRDYPSIDHRHSAFVEAFKAAASYDGRAMFPILLNARPALDDHDGLLTSMLPSVILFTPEHAKTLLDKRANPNGPSESGWTALQAALSDGHEELAKFLIEKGANVSDPEALERAATAGMEGIVELLLDRGCDIDATRDRFTPLAAAAMAGQTKVVELLLSRGANLESMSSGELTPLGEVAFDGLVEPAMILVTRGANVNANGINGTPMMRAAIHGHEQFITLLLDHGAEINAISKGFGKETVLYEAATYGHKGLCQLLLDRGADPNLAGEFGSPLMAAVGRSSREIANMLLEHGADPNFRCPDGKCALEAAVSGGNEGLVRLLMDKGADLHVRGGEHGSILHAAVSSRSNDMVQIVLDLGARALEGDEKYGGVLHSASQTNYALLIENGADVNARGGEYGNALQAAIAKRRDGFPSTSSSTKEEDKLEAVHFLIKAGADVNATGGVYGTALQAASRKGYERIVALLLDHSADVNATGGFYGNALQAASRRGDERIVALLLGQGASPTLEGGRYGTPLQAAAYRGNESVVELLLDSGAEINRQGGLYNTALQAAAFRGHEAVVKLLLERGADVNIQGGKFHNALRAAREEIKHRHKVVDKILLDHGAVDDSPPEPEPEEEEDGWRARHIRRRRERAESSPYVSDDE